MINLKDIRDLDKDALLGALGVRRIGGADWLTPAVAGLAVGLLAGSALGLLFAPLAGPELRVSVRRRIADARAEADSAAALESSQGRPESGQQPEA